MARYLAVLAGTVVGLAVLWLTAVWTGAAIPRQAAATSAAVLDAKRAYARTAGSPKLIFVGGSNVMLALKTAEIERRLGMPTVNFGLWITLPLDYTAKVVAETVAAGDVVVLAFEYWTYTETSKDWLHNILLYDRAWFDALPWDRQIDLALGYPKARLFEAASDLLHGGRGAASGPFVQRNGDAVDETFAPLSEGQLAHIRSRRPFPHDKRVAEGAGNWQAIRGLIDRLRARGAVVLATFPPYLRFDDYDRPAQRAFFDRVVAFYRDAGVPVLGTPQEFMVGRDEIYDSEYHLNPDGIVRRTRRMIGLLGPYVAADRRGGADRR